VGKCLAPNEHTGNLKESGPKDFVIPETRIGQSISGTSPENMKAFEDISL
jgi:hypothetical protein